MQRYAKQIMAVVFALFLSFSAATLASARGVSNGGGHGAGNSGTAHIGGHGGNVYIGTGHTGIDHSNTGKGHGR
jgi:hypothetical protein